jgi:hypothetical protein
VCCITRTLTPTHDQAGVLQQRVHTVWRAMSHQVGREATSTRRLDASRRDTYEACCPSICQSQIATVQAFPGQIRQLFGQLQLDVDADALEMPLQRRTHPPAKTQRGRQS